MSFEDTRSHHWMRQCLSVHRSRRYNKCARQAIFSQMSSLGSKLCSAPLYEALGSDAVSDTGPRGGGSPILIMSRAASGPTDLCIREKRRREGGFRWYMLAAPTSPDLLVPMPLRECTGRTGGGRWSAVAATSARWYVAPGRGCLPVLRG